MAELHFLVYGDPAAGWEYASDRYDYDEGSYSRGYVCLACLRERLVQPVSDASRSLLCHWHSCLYREWRKRHGLPPLSRRRTARRPSAAERGRRCRARLLELLKDGPMTTPQLAGMLNLTCEAVKHQLRKLMAAGEVARAGTAARGAIVWERVS